MPCFHSLLPEPHNATVLFMLFILGTWHSLAKLRMHTDFLLELLDDTTTCLGITLRYFTQVTCPEFATKETAAEFEKRKRKEATSTKKAPSPSAQQPKTFNMKTIKLHSLGDYVSHIRTYGTTDLYSTSTVSLTFTLGCTCELYFDLGVEPELSHGRVKTWHKTRTSKKNTMRQLGNIDFVESQVRQIAAKVDTAGTPMKSVSPPPKTSPATCYHIAQDIKKPLILGEWLVDHSNDPALTVANLFTNHDIISKHSLYHRTSSPISNNIYMLACVSQICCTITKDRKTLPFKMEYSINTRSCKSILQPMTFNRIKTLFTFPSTNETFSFTTHRNKAHTYGHLPRFLVFIT